MKILNSITIVFYLLATVQVFGTTINVPGDQPSIQSAIDAAVIGDSVLVAPGIYYENINFSGKDIVVASHYILTHDTASIINTVIDGSQPTDPDTSSCVLIVNGESSAAVLKGFTITGGAGTFWEDEHGGGNYYWEGGGILIQDSDPTISNNIIENNTATNLANDAVSAGGGAIRVGDGAPLIESNIIRNNQGLYGGGIVFNYGSGTVRGNVIAGNSVIVPSENANTFGGGGIWMTGNDVSGHVTIENNTIVGNSSAGGTSGAEGGGGAILVWNTAAVIRNNIIWNNIQEHNNDLLILDVYDTVVEYNCLAGLVDLGTNIDADPLFCDQSQNDYGLAGNSPCISAGSDNSNIGALGVGCENKFVIRYINTVVEYGPAFEDELHIEVHLDNPNNLSLSTYAIIFDSAGSAVDSILLNDLGVSGDGVAGDGCWSGIDTVENWEADFQVRVKATDHSNGNIHWSYDTAMETTIGPVEFLEIIFPYNDDVLRPGTDIYGIITLSNSGTDTKTGDLTATISHNHDEYIIPLMVSPQLPFDSIAPGEFKSSSIFYSIRLSDSIPPETDLNFTIDISSDGNHFWSDSFNLHISAPLNTTLDNSQPGSFMIFPNYPNPFNPVTSISYELSQLSDVRIVVLDLAGREVTTLVSETQEAGFKSINWDATSVASGMYFYQIRVNYPGGIGVGEFVQTRTMVLLK